MTTQTLKQLLCLRCGNKWFPRGTEKPKACANRLCNSPLWDKPRRNGITGAVTKIQSTPAPSRRVIK